MRSDRETKMSGHNKPVIGLRPIKERNKRSEAMIEEQVGNSINVEISVCSIHSIVFDFEIQISLQRNLDKYALFLAWLIIY